jgi:hypothetical protein
MGAGGEVQIEVHKQQGSMSILVPQQDPLAHRACIEHTRARLLYWFAKIELQAWEWVNAIYRHEHRPDKIFLVTGQTLTKQFAIAHHETGGAACGLVVTSKVGVTSILKAEMRLGYHLQNVTASTGFKFSPPSDTGDPVLFSVYMETFDSKPIRRLRLERGSPLLTCINAAFVSCSRLWLDLTVVFSKRLRADNFGAWRPEGQPQGPRVSVLYRVTTYRTTCPNAIRTKL